MEIWHIWILVAVSLFILEVFTPTFFFACIGIGCAAAGMAALLCADSSGLQWTLFAAAAVVSFAFLRPIVQKYIYRRQEAVKTNVDVLVGKIGRVTETINSAAGTGRALVGGDDWRARTEDGTILPENTHVVVVGMDGITIVVEKK